MSWERTDKDSDISQVAGRRASLQTEINKISSHSPPLLHYINCILCVYIYRRTKKKRLYSLLEASAVNFIFEKIILKFLIGDDIDKCVYF